MSDLKKNADVKGIGLDADAQLCFAVRRYVGPEVSNRAGYRVKEKLLHRSEEK